MTSRLSGEGRSRDAGGGPARIVVVGGGIAGLAAAWHLVSAAPRAVEVTVLEAGRELGGKLRTGELTGIPVDEGAESMLAARPEGVVLAREVGLADDLVYPATTAAALLVGDRLRPLPRGMISGIPTDLRALAASGIISLRGLLRLPLDHWLPRTSIANDVSVGDFVATRLGAEVVDKLVEPMLGGVYAGRAENLSLDMTLPVVSRLARRERSLIAAAREALRTGATSAGARKGPALVGINGGLGKLPRAVATNLRAGGVVIETDAEARDLWRTRGGWSVSVVDGNNGSRTRRVIGAHGVVLAVPATVASRLLTRGNPRAAAILGTIAYASVAVVGLAYRLGKAPGLPSGSGFLVPASEGRSIKAVTFSSRKWAWMGNSMARTPQAHGTDGPVVVVRASVGRFGDVVATTMDDAEMVRAVSRDLTEIAGLPSRPVAARVTRWPEGLPQYFVGHRARVADVRELLGSTPGVAVCGAAYDGVGVSACIGSARHAAHQVVARIGEQE